MSLATIQNLFQAGWPSCSCREQEGLVLTWEQGKVTEQKPQCRPSTAPRAPQPCPKGAPAPGLSQRAAGVKSELVCTCLVSAAFFFLSPTPFSSHLLLSVHGFCFIFSCSAGVSRAARGCDTPGVTHPHSSSLLPHSLTQAPEQTLCTLQSSQTKPVRGSTCPSPPAQPQPGAVQGPLPTAHLPSLSPTQQPLQPTQGALGPAEQHNHRILYVGKESEGRGVQLFPSTASATMNLCPQVPQNLSAPSSAKQQLHTLMEPTALGAGAC